MVYLTFWAGNKTPLRQRPRLQTGFHNWKKEFDELERNWMKITLVD